jgi:two-component system response regulator RstA
MPRGRRQPRRRTPTFVSVGIAAPASDARACDTASVLEKLLVVEDDEALATLVAGFLSGEGYRVSTERDGARAAERILAERPDAVLLDLVLPGLDGLAVLRRVRPAYGGAILVLTARGEEADEVQVLDAGADDYMAKPVRPRALLARLEALARRGRAPTGAGPRLAIDVARRVALLDGRAVPLTTAEFDLVAVLHAHAGEIIDRDALYRLLYGRAWDGLDRSVDLRVSRLRRKLGDDANLLLKSVRGTGYLLVPDGR